MGKRSRHVSLSPSGHDRLARSLTPPAATEDDCVSKLVATDDPLAAGHPVAMRCSLPPHTTTLEFPSVDAFEVHYAKDHTNRCSSCGRNLPSAHLLNLHIDENHNPLRRALAAKGEKTYACFVEDCDRKCSTPQKRRLHMIDKHSFPRIYDFRVIDHGIDDAASLLREGRKRRVSTTTNMPSRHQHYPPTVAHPDDLQGQMEMSNANVTAGLGYSGAKTPSVAESSSYHTTSPPTPNSDGDHDAMQDLETSLAALQFVPRSVMSKQRHEKS